MSETRAEIGSSGGYSMRNGAAVSSAAWSSVSVGAASSTARSYHLIASMKEVAFRTHPELGPPATSVEHELHVRQDGFMIRLESIQRRCVGAGPLRGGKDMVDTHPQ